MNCIDLFRNASIQDSAKPALWMPPNHVTTFGQLQQGAAAAQRLCRKCGVKRGDGVLLVDSISPRLYASVIGILGMGAHAILVEPWMPLPLLNRAIDLVKPKLFLTNLWGRAWGLRVQAIREIPAWSGFKYNLDSSSELEAEAVPTETLAMVTFTTGTTGNPKGVVRTHGLLVEQHFALSDALRSNDFTGADLTVFANMALSNLASGRCSLLVPSQPKNNFFHLLKQLPSSLAPVTMTCGPAFLKELLNTAPLASLQSVHVGGALADCQLFEKGFSLLPDARWLHVYGSSEAEPVACADARRAVQESKKKGYFQTLYLGHLIPEIQANIDRDSTWVSGLHVSPFYLGDDFSNRRYKRLDESGRIWHDMGDRIVVSEDAWWYCGRSSQEIEEFFLEQQIYSFLQLSTCFVQRDEDGGLYLFGENVHRRRQELLQKFPMLEDVFEVVIYRDQRHHARINRQKSLEKGAPWIVG